MNSPENIKPKVTHYSSNVAVKNTISSNYYEYLMELIDYNEGEGRKKRVLKLSNIYNYKYNVILIKDVINGNIDTPHKISKSFKDKEGSNGFKIKMLDNTSLHIIADTTIDKNKWMRLLQPRSLPKIHVENIKKALSMNSTSRLFTGTEVYSAILNVTGYTENLIIMAIGRSLLRPQKRHDGMQLPPILVRNSGKYPDVFEDSSLVNYSFYGEDIKVPKDSKFSEYLGYLVSRSRSQFYYNLPTSLHSPLFSIRKKVENSFKSPSYVESPSKKSPKKEVIVENTNENYNQIKREIWEYPLDEMKERTKEKVFLDLESKFENESNLAHVDLLLSLHTKKYKKRKAKLFQNSHYHALCAEKALELMEQTDDDLDYVFHYKKKLFEKKPEISKDMKIISNISINSKRMKRAFENLHYLQENRAYFIRYFVNRKNETNDKSFDNLYSNITTKEMKTITLKTIYEAVIKFNELEMNLFYLEENKKEEYLREYFMENYQNAFHPVREHFLIYMKYTFENLHEWLEDEKYMKLGRRILMLIQVQHDYRNKILYQYGQLKDYEHLYDFVNMYYQTYKAWLLRKFNENTQNLSPVESVVKAIDMLKQIIYNLPPQDDFSSSTLLFKDYPMMKVDLRGFATSIVQQWIIKRVRNQRLDVFEKYHLISFCSRYYEMMKPFEIHLKRVSSSIHSFDDTINAIFMAINEHIHTEIFNRFIAVTFQNFGFKLQQDNEWVLKKPETVSFDHIIPIKMNQQMQHLESKFLGDDGKLLDFVFVLFYKNLTKIFLVGLSTIETMHRKFIADCDHVRLLYHGILLYNLLYMLPEMRNMGNNLKAVKEDSSNPPQSVINILKTMDDELKNAGEMYKLLMNKTLERILKAFYDDVGKQVKLTTIVDENNHEVIRIDQLAHSKKWVKRMKLKWTYANLAEFSCLNLQNNTPLKRYKEDIITLEESRNENSDIFLSEKYPLLFRSNLDLNLITHFCKGFLPLKEGHICKNWIYSLIYDRYNMCIALFDLPAKSYSHLCDHFLYLIISLFYSLAKPKFQDAIDERDYELCNIILNHIRDITYLPKEYESDFKKVIKLIYDWCVHDQQSSVDLENLLCKLIDAIKFPHTSRKKAKSYINEYFSKDHNTPVSKFTLEKNAFRLQVKHMFQKMNEDKNTIQLNHDHSFSLFFKNVLYLFHQDPSLNPNLEGYIERFSHQENKSTQQTEKEIQYFIQNMKIDKRDPNEEHNQSSKLILYDDESEDDYSQIE